VLAFATIDLLTEAPLVLGICIRDEEGRFGVELCLLIIISF
jgi:hypothetical protein